MSVLDRNEIFTSALRVYDERHGEPQPPRLVLMTAVDMVISAYATPDRKAALLASMADAKREMLPLENLSPISQEIFDIGDAVVEAVRRQLCAMN